MRAENFYHTGSSVTVAAVAFSLLSAPPDISLPIAKRTIRHLFPITQRGVALSEKLIEVEKEREQVSASEETATVIFLESGPRAFHFIEDELDDDTVFDLRGANRREIELVVTEVGLAGFDFQE